MKKDILIAVFLIIGFHSCVEDQTLRVEEFILHPDFEISLIAAEPLLDSPVDMDIDPGGNIWAVELTGYMRDIDGSGENDPDGNIVRLSDRDGDGVMDHRDVIMDGLIAPRAFALVYNGFLYNNGDTLWWCNLDLSTKVMVDDHYVDGGNIEHQPNGLFYHMDNWIYNAKSNARYRRINGEWKKEVTSFRGQWGISADAMGRIFYNDNSNLLRGDYLLPNQIIRNKYLDITNATNELWSPDNRVFPVQPTSVNRGYKPGVLDKNEKLINATSACGPVIYLGHEYPIEMNGDAFVCVPEINAVKWLRIDNNKVFPNASHPSDTIEFLVSRDETFRPVNLYNGPEGGLYVLDMRKGIIQHRAYMTHYLREQILGKSLQNITGKGRIYRISHKTGISEASIDWYQLTTQDLIHLLQHENGHFRLKAQKYLIFNGDTSIKNMLEIKATDTSSQIGQIHALWTLEGLGLLTKDILKEAALSSKEPLTITHILRLMSLMDDWEDEDLVTIIDHAVNLNHLTADLQLCHTSGIFYRDDLWLSLAKKYNNQPVYAEALISGISEREDELLIKYGPKPDTITSFLRQTIAHRKANKVQVMSLEAVNYKDVRTSGFELYNRYCSACHRMDGKGNKGLAPPLADSRILGEAPEKSALVILQGLQGPVTVGGITYELNLSMPGLKNNPDLSDQDIVDIVHFIRNAFVAEWSQIDSSKVSQLREQVKDRNALLTEAELLEE